MISAATGAMALLMVTLVKDHGLQYLLAATILTGFIQILAGYLKLGALMRFVSKSVVIGFVNALAILIFMAQLPELTNVTWHVYAMTVGGLAIIYLFPLYPSDREAFTLSPHLYCPPYALCLVHWFRCKNRRRYGAIAGYASNFLAS
ncbi:inorganic anion transporter, SulP domain protein [Acinetobacter baumannii MRSN 4106]|nr:inorganic anion transporter, SulP domain protein [Acinetobacter baumannii MRSN 4106]